jgi:phosphohistidine phosphatase SixA
LIILIRHAEKARTPPEDPPLSQAGKKRAEALAAALGAAKVRRMITTDLRRTYETARPLAQALALNPIVINLKDNQRDVNTHVGQVVDAIRASNNGSVLVVGHTITIPDIIARPGGPSVMHYPQCNGKGDWSLTLTNFDKNGIACLYGAARGFTIDPQICKPK